MNVKNVSILYFRIQQNQGKQNQGKLLERKFEENKTNDEKYTQW